MAHCASQGLQRSRDSPTCWQTRLGPRGTGVYIASNVAFAWALRLWALPWLERANEKHERIRRELAEQLGREPTDDELFEHLMNAHKR